MHAHKTTTAVGKCTTVCVNFATLHGWRCAGLARALEDLISSMQGAATRRQIHRDRSGSITLQALLHTMMNRQALVYFSIVRRSAAYRGLLVSQGVGQMESLFSNVLGA